jgi:hypothetical protein
MSHAAFKVIEIEKSSSNTQGDIIMSKLFAEPDNRTLLGDRVTRRVVEVVDFELAQGSMPA